MIIVAIKYLCFFLFCPPSHQEEWGQLSERSNIHTSSSATGGTGPLQKPACLTCVEPGAPSGLDSEYLLSVQRREKQKKTR